MRVEAVPLLGSEAGPARQESANPEGGRRVLDPGWGAPGSQLPRFQDAHPGRDCQIRRPSATFIRQKNPLPETITQKQHWPAKEEPQPQPSG